MSDAAKTRTGVQVATEHAPIAFLFLLFKTNILIDSDRHFVKWGMNYFQLQPGHHSIEIGFRYFFGKNMGRMSAEFDLAPGQVTRVTYHAPNQVFAPGTIFVN